MTVESLLDLIPIDFGGGCGLSKAKLMYYLIEKYNIKESVDIGVYRGRSLVPQALAHKNHSKGIVFGVDPYNNKLISVNSDKELKKKINKFRKENNFDKVYREVKNLLKTTSLDSSVKFIRQTSNEAVKYFEKKSIHPRLIHIDGDHDTKVVVDDVLKYTQILGPNGFIVMDDISWGSVKPAVDIISNAPNFKLLFCKVSTQNDYAVFTNIKSTRKNKNLVSNLYQFGQYE